jgi:uncharacterized protein YijF (DUF1287 family)
MQCGDIVQTASRQQQIDISGKEKADNQADYRQHQKQPNLKFGSIHKYSLSS